jgi:hypothetical protein
MMKKHIPFVLIAPLLLVACSSTKTVRVAVPPRVDLRQYPTVGMITFASSNTNAELEQFATQRFLQEVQSAQPGTRVVELGTEQAVLSSVGRRNWDAATLRTVGQQHGVDVLFIGQLDVEKAKTKVQLSTMLKNIKARQDVNAGLTARLIETGTGATMWTDACKLTTTVSHASVGSRGGHFGSSDVEEAYGEMVGALVWDVTDDFRETYVTRRVRKDEIHTASAAD